MRPIQVFGEDIIPPVPHLGRYIYTRTEGPLRLKLRTWVHFQNNAAKRLQVTRQHFKDNPNLGGGVLLNPGWWEEFTRFPIVKSPAGSQSLCNVYNQVKMIRGSGAVLPGVLHPSLHVNSSNGARCCMGCISPPARESDRQTHFSLSPPLPPLPTFASSTPPHDLRRSHSASTESPVPCAARVIPRIADGVVRLPLLSQLLTARGKEASLSHGV